MTFFCQVLFGSLVVAFTLGLSSAMDICKEKDKPGFQLKLLGTALFQKYLLLITRDDNHRDYTVYKIGFNDFGNSYGQMYIGLPGVPIEQYWPTFKDDTIWHAIRGNVISIWLIDKVNPFLYFFVPTGQNGSSLDVNSGKFGQPIGWAIHHNIPTQIISDADTSHTYSSKSNDGVGGVYMLYVWQVRLSETGEFSDTKYHDASHLYYARNKKTKQVENITFMYDYNRPLQIVTPENDPYRKMKGYEDFELVKFDDWNLSPNYIPPGFIFKQQFHMFALDKVFIFADLLTFEDPKLKEGQIWYTTPVKVVPYKDFFTCDISKLVKVSYPRVGPLDTDNATAKQESRVEGVGSNLAWLWIFLSILLGLLLILVPLWMYYRRKSKSKSHHGASHKKSHSAHSHKSKRKSKSAPLKLSSSRKRVNSLKNKSSGKNKSSSKHKKKSSSKKSRGTQSSARKVK